MNDLLSDIRDRQDRFEVRVTDLEATVKKQADLRAEMDKKLDDIPPKLEAHRLSLNALGKVQSDHTKRLQRIEDKSDKAEVLLGRLDERMTGVETRLDGVDTRLDGIDTRLDRVDARLDGVDTRLDGIDTRLDGIDTRLNGVDTRLDGIDTRLGRVETGLADVKAGVDAILDRLGNG